MKEDRGFLNAQRYSL